MSAGGDRQAPTKSLYILYLEVKAVVNNRRVDSLLQSGVAAQGEDDFSPLQLSFIREIYKEKEPLAGLILLYTFVGIARQTSSFVSLCRELLYSTRLIQLKTASLPGIHRVCSSYNELSTDTDSLLAQQRRSCLCWWHPFVNISMDSTW